MNLSHLYYFQTLSKTLHYRVASEELNISQPNLTYAIKELEHELGVKLFYKKKRSIVLSKDGQIFLDYVNKSLDILQEGIERVSLNRDLEVSIVPNMVPRFVRFLSNYKDLHPEIGVSLHSEKTSLIINGVTNGDYDLGLCNYSSDTELEKVVVSKEDFVVIVSNKHPLASKQSVSIKDLNNENVYCYRKNLEIYAVIKDKLDLFDVSIHELDYLDDEVSLAAMVEVGQGIAIIADHDSMKYSAEIKKLAIDEKEFHRKIFAYYNKEDVNPLVLDFIDIMLSFSGKKYGELLNEYDLY